jgi:hypothetical protein
MAFVTINGRLPPSAEDRADIGIDNMQLSIPMSDSLKRNRRISSAHCSSLA